MTLDGIIQTALFLILGYLLNNLRISIKSLTDAMISHTAQLARLEQFEKDIREDIENQTNRLNDHGKRIGALEQSQAVISSIHMNCIRGK